MKMFKSRKALSPVVASIILIAVTVAVSIAVAAWMGALTFTFTSTEQITFTNHQWGTPGTDVVPWINITIRNSGSTDMSIAEWRIDGSNNVTMVSVVPNEAYPNYLLEKGTTASFVIRPGNNGNFTRGSSYDFTVVTTKGNTFGPYVKTAP